LLVDEKSAEGKLLRDANITGTRSERQIAGQRVTMISSVNTAGLVLKRDGNLFVIKATGPDAAQLLLQVAPAVRFDH
jgi:hypothetical protein